MVRHTGTRHWPIIAHCPKYRIEGTILHDTDKGSQEQWKHDIWTVNKPLIDLGPQNLLSNALDIVPLHQQARWLEYLSQFNLVICFYPRCLSTKPDTLTRWWDIYPKGGDNGYASVNPHNFCLVFTHEQITASLWATILTTPTLHVAMILDQNQLHSNILAALSSNSSISEYLLCPEGHWSKDNTGFLRLNDKMYVPDNANLHLQVLQYHHDHVLAGHLGQNKTLGLIQRHYIWPDICDDIQKFCKSCVTCMRSKP